MVGAREGREGKAEGAQSAGLKAEPVPWGSRPVGGGDGGAQGRPVQRQDRGKLHCSVNGPTHFTVRVKAHSPSQARDRPLVKTWNCVRMIFVSAQGELRQSSGGEGAEKRKTGRKKRERVSPRRGIEPRSPA